MPTSHRTSIFTSRRRAGPVGRALRMLAALSIPFLAACSGTVPAPSPAEGSPAPTYVIGPGDSLNIFVYRSPELSVDVPVRPDGRVSMPLVPDIEAAGPTPTPLAAEVTARLRQYVREPVVSVIVKTFVGQSSDLVRVIGEATQPIAIPYREGMTLLDMLVASRGLTRYAAGDRSRLIRRTEAGQESIPIRLSSLLRDGDISQNRALRPGDTIIIPQSWF
jgi:polysaccharide biosynthesis/export protein